MLNVGRLMATLGLDSSEYDAGLDTAEGSFGGFGSKLALAAGGLAIGAIITGEITNSIDQMGTTDLLAGRLGLTGEDAERAASIAGDAYAGAWGESMDEVSAAVQGVGVNLAEFGSSSDDDIMRATTGALDLAKVFDEDVNRVTQVAGDLVRNGMAKDFDEAFDVMAAGMTNGLNRSGDFLDVLNEYAEPLASIGIEGPEALALFEGALDAGAWNLDKVGDAMKEFGIRSVDGSKASAEAYEALGLDAEAMGQKMLAGGDSAEEGMSQVIQALMAMEDPLAQDAAGVALFGTTWEDLGPQVIASLDPATAAVEDNSEAMEQMSDTINDNLGTAITAFKRQMSQHVVNFITTKVVPIVEKIIGFFDEHRDVLLALGIAIGAVLLPTLAALVISLGAVAISAALAAAPFIAVGLVIAALAYGIIQLVKHWDDVVEFLGNLVSSIGEVPGLIVEWLGDLGGFLVDKGTELLQGFLDGATDFVLTVLKLWYVELPLLIVGFIGDVLGTLVDKGSDIIQGMLNGAKNLVESALRAYFVTIPSLVFNFIGDIYSYVMGKGSDIINGIHQGAIDVISTLLGWIGEIPSKAWNAIGDIFTYMMGKGGDLINGFLQGLKDAWGAVADWITGKIDWVKNQFTSGFGLFSPSKVFMGYGEDIMEGLGIGLGRDVVVGDRISDIARGSTVGASSRVVNNNFNISGVGDMNAWRREQARIDAMARISGREDRY